VLFRIISACACASSSSVFTLSFSTFVTFSSSGNSSFSFLSSSASATERRFNAPDAPKFALICSSSGPFADSRLPVASIVALFCSITLSTYDFAPSAVLVHAGISSPKWFCSKSAACAADCCFATAS
jgi:hypothetical protein